MQIQNLKFYSVLSFIIVMLAALVQFNTYLAPDLGWHLNIAKGMLSGKQLYVDFFEVNTPLIIYITAIPTLLSQLLHVDIVLGLNIFNFMLATTSLIICHNVIQKSGSNNILLCFIAFALFILPLSFPMSEFGQKEHIFMLLFMPYLLEFALKLKPQTSLFLLACIGMLIKPFFILAYLGIFIVRLMERDRIMLNEVLLLGIINIAFYLSMWVMHRAYFSTVMPIAIDGYSNLALTEGSLKSRIIIFLFVSMYSLNYYILPLILSPLTLTKTHARLMPAILVLFLMVCVQGKNFWYHYIPMLMVCVLLFGMMFIEYVKDKNAMQFLKIVNLVLIAGCLVNSISPVVSNYLNQNNKVKQHYMKIIESINQYKDQKVLVLSFDLAYIFPSSLYSNIEWNMKQHSLQILEGVYKDPQEIDAKNKTLEYVARDVIEAMQYKPTAIFVQKPSARLINSNKTYAFFFKSGHNYIDFFSQYKDFRQLWGMYKLKGVVGDETNKFEIYELKERG